MKTFPLALLAILMNFIPTDSKSQVKVGGTNTVIDPSVAFEVESTDKGLLPPRMTSAQRDAIVSPVEGLRIYNLTTRCENYFNGLSWFELCGNCVPGAPSIPGPVAGSVLLCPGAGPQSYSIQAVANATTYNWTVPSGWNITSGGSTQSIIVTPSAQGGNVLVSAQNTCGSGPVSILNVTVEATLTAPTAGSQIASENQIEWHWNTVQGATSYRHNSTNTLVGSTQTNGTAYTQTSLAGCGSEYTLYVWAENACSTSDALILTESTSSSSATGGTVTQSGNYTIHTFNGSGTFVAGCASTVEVLVVAGGGGGGGGWEGAGGGAGGVSYHNSFPVTPGQSYTVTVGNGGAGSGQQGGNGENSTFAGSIISIGGGGGGTVNAGTGFNGGSGGGSARDIGAGSSTQTNTGGATGYGNAGGGPGTSSSAIRIGGGGGAGAPGEFPTQDEYGGAGGIGIAFDISGISSYYGGGGGAGASSSSGNGGLGGGGKGSMQGNAGGLINGTPNTGGGGGGERYLGYGGGNGGSGIVIIRY